MRPALRQQSVGHRDTAKQTPTLTTHLTRSKSLGKNLADNSPSPRMPKNERRNSQVSKSTSQEKKAQKAESVSN